MIKISNKIHNHRGRGENSTKLGRLQVVFTDVVVFVITVWFYCR